MNLSIDPLIKSTGSSGGSGCKCQPFDKMPVVFFTENGEVFRKDFCVTDGDVSELFPPPQEPPYYGYGYGYDGNSDIFIGSLDGII